MAPCMQNAVTLHAPSIGTHVRRRPCACETLFRSTPAEASRMRAACAPRRTACTRPAPLMRRHTTRSHDACGTHTPRHHGECVVSRRSCNPVHTDPPGSAKRIRRDRATMPDDCTRWKWQVQKGPLWPREKDFPPLVKHAVRVLLGSRRSVETVPRRDVGNGPRFARNAFTTHGRSRPSTRFASPPLRCGPSDDCRDRPCGKPLRASRKAGPQSTG